MGQSDGQLIRATLSQVCSLSLANAQLLIWATR